ncbi:hypothetical protein B7L70_02360 [Vulcanisaeta sp. EB80]|jgi:chaperonin cofactor prefoldin|uniref:hypothetical protein n=1 Tax=Vulcanisaeta sp. EB80 TaxID=1650660 RepID=UPI0009BD9B94|nr:hypothetical protein [Vulcanisaeta sp. EB80]PLC68608.1 hypothetical protein B7L70_02360 [Vulcanisaeta sp. EB80]
MASVKAYLVGLVVLVVVAVVFAILWFMAYTNYTSLETKYANLQSQYNTLESNYTTLKTNYNNLQSQYQALQTQYNSLQSQYSSLQTNYTTLQGQYQALEANYNNLITAFASAESYSGVYYLNPGNVTMFEIVVPKGYNATVSIDVSSSDSLVVAVAPLDVFNEYEEGLITSWALAPGVTYYTGYTISKLITLSPGSYIIVAMCGPTNEFGANVYVNITTTLTPTS